MITTVHGLFEAHLEVASLDTSIGFYRDRLGLELAHVVPSRQAAFFWIGARGKTMLGLWQAGAGPQRTTTHIAFAASIDDVLSAAGTLRPSGITPLDFDGEPTDEPVVLAWMPAVSIYFRDPDGHLLEYIAMLSDEPRPGDGVQSWGEWTRRRSVDDGRTNVAPRVREGHAVRVLALSGSLRRTSSNSALLDAAVRVAPADIVISIYGDLATIPPFNPDLDTDHGPAAVKAFRAALEACDAVLISSPEYAHGVSGVLKNALDWVVGSGELIDKPLALLNASARASHAHASLHETLSTMSAHVVDEASMTIPLDGTAGDGVSIAADGRLAARLRSALAALARSTRMAGAP